LRACAIGWRSSSAAERRHAGRPQHGPTRSSAYKGLVESHRQLHRLGHLRLEFVLGLTLQSKPVMYIKDLLKLLEHHWLSDRSVFLHERQRVHLSALILILASTLSRPGAIIESDGAVSTDKALSYGNMRVFIIRKPSKPDRNVIILEITLFLPKCHQREQKQKP